MKTTVIYMLAFCLAGLPACQEQGRVREEPAARDRGQEADAVGKPTATQSSRLLVTEKAFFGIQVQDTLAALQAKFPGRVVEGIKKTGEGDFLVYSVYDEAGEHVATLYPDPQHPQVVGQIAIVTPRAATAAGVSVGDTFAELQRKAGPVEVHGSEVEGQTYASKGGIFYKLDIRHFTYELNQRNIDPGVKITELVIQ